MAQAAQEMRRVQRNLDTHLAKRAHMRSARREAFLKNDQIHHDVRVNKADFPCLSLCLDCGYVSSERGKSCPACGKPSWVDLTFDQAADMVRDIESGRRAAAPGWIKWLVAIVVALTVVGAWIGLTHLLQAGVIGSAAHGLAVLAAPAVAFPLALLLRRPATRLLDRPSLRHPARWRGPLRPDQRLGEPNLQVSGQVKARAGLLTSPFGGQPCVAYEVALRLHDNRSLRAPQWLLRESRSVALEVGAVPVEPDRGLLGGRLERVELDGTEESRARLSRFLRERGLVDNDGDLELYEVVLPEGREMSLEVHSDPSVALVSDLDTASARARRHGGPYR